MTSPVLLFILLTSSVTIAGGARILMNSPQIISHVLEQVALGEELVKGGHEVFVALESNFPQSQVDAIAKKGIKILRFQVPANEYRFAGPEFETFLASSIFSGQMDMLATKEILENIMIRDCHCLMQDQAFIRRVKELDFQLGVVEPFFFGYCSLILPAHLNIPFVTLTNMYDWFAIRAPALPSFYPRFFLSMDKTLEISFSTRFAQFLMQAALAINFPVRLHTNTTLLELYAPAYTSWKELLRQSSLFFYEVDHHLAAALPSMPNHISLAGLTCKPAKPLPDDLEALMTSNKNGVILMTFGSLGNLFPDEIIDKFFEAFSRLEQTVIAKFKVDPSRKVPSNVRMLSWLPQNDILGHENLRLFITHCGNNGQHESLYHGKPMLGFPLYAEQKENCHRAAMKGFAQCMDINQFTAQQLADNIQHMIQDETYKQKIGRASTIFRDQPLTPQRRATYWIDHVIKHGSSHLRSTAMDLPLYQFLLLDVIAVLCLLLALVLVVFVAVFKLLSRCLCSVRSSKLKTN